MSVRVPFVDLRATNEPLRDEFEAAFRRVLADNDFGVDGETAAFEAALADRVGTAAAVGVNSGTAALQLTLAAAGVGPGDEVVLPPNTFIATAEAVVAVGATPVLADVDPSTALMDPDAAEAAVTPRTAALVAVHLYGQPADMDALRGVADRHGLFLLEDAAQAIGASWSGIPVGALGDAAAFSFYPTKNLGALGQGGAVTTNDRDLAARVASLRSHGEGPKNLHTRWGSNERLDGLQAAFLRVKLDHLDDAQERRSVAARRYWEWLKDVPGVELLGWYPRAWPVHHLMVVRVEDRERVRHDLYAEGVETGVHYPTPIHLQPVGSGLAPEGSLPHAERHAVTTLSLPLFPEISDEQIDHCVFALTGAVASRPAPARRTSPSPGRSLVRAVR